LVFLPEVFPVCFMVLRHEMVLLGVDKTVRVAGPAAILVFAAMG
jgi:hypothetical protein